MGTSLNSGTALREAIACFDILAQACYLHGGDDEAPVHDKLAKCCRPLVAVPPMHHEQPADVSELRDGEVRCQRSLLPLLKNHKEPLRDTTH